MEKPEKRSALIIGAGIYGLITAKSLLYDSGSFFHSVEIFEKNTDLGGVWARNRIYEGLTTNSPLLTYEIPGFPYPEELRKAGSHVKAQDVNSYLKAYAERFDLTRRIRFDCRVEDVSWDALHSMWMVRCQEATQTFTKDFSHIVVCTGLYHSSHMPLSKSQTLQFNGHIWHSCDVSSPAVQRMLGTSQSVVVVGAGKSALDLATLVAQGRFSAPTSHVAPAVKLVYRRPHWLAPRKIFQNSVSFEKVLFSRFVNAWLPFVTPPDYFHYLIAETAVGQWLTRQIFRFIAYDFIRSNGQQDLPQTIPHHSLAQALSGALHVEPPGYLECVRDGRIEVCEGSIDMLQDHTAHLINKHGEGRVVNADNVILATGYNLALPFFSPPLLHDLGLVSSSDAIDDLNNLSYIRLYRLIAPPRAVHPPTTGKSPRPYRNIALNGFAYSLLNPTVAFVAAHWISDYFRGRIQTPPQDVIDEDVIRFHAWQTACFGTHGAKGVHIGPHATLYTDQLLSDMKLTSGHIRDGMGGLLRTIRDWLRPMFPEIYAYVTKDREERDRQEGLS